MKLRDGLHISGKIKIDTFNAGMVDSATPYLEAIKYYKKLIHTPFLEGDLVHVYRNRIQHLKQELQTIKDNYFIRTALETKNLVMDSPNYGLDLIIQRLVGINTYSLNILWIEIGTGTTAPTVNDTALTTPSVRLAVSFQEDYATTDAIVQAYVADANLPNATYGEVGSFVDGTATIGTGQLFNHALISPTFTKTAGTDVTIECDFTIVNS